MPKKPIVILDEETRQQIIKLAEEGKTPKQIAQALDMIEGDFKKAVKHDPNYRAIFEQARQEGLESLADSLLTVAEEVDDVQKAKLKSDNIKWVLSKRKPGTYGDRIDINVQGTIDISAALSEARSRAMLPIMPSSAIVDAESSTISDSSVQCATDIKSVDLEDMLK